VTGVPLSGQLSFIVHGIEDQPTSPGELPPMAFLTNVDHGYFDAMNIRVVDGRDLTADDGAHRFRGMVVSRAYAQKWWPDGSAVGRRLEVGPGPAWEVVGVVENVRNRGLQQEPEELMYLPMTFGTVEEPQTVRTRELVVRVSGDPLAFLPVVRREAGALNSRIPLSNPRRMTDVIRTAAAETSFTMAVLGSASTVALLLGLIGIYGVVSYVVTQRTRELGVRMALGATRATVRGMVVRHGLLLAGIGVAAGLALAVGASRLIESLLFGVSARDPLTYAAVAVALIAIAWLASWIPAQRAAGVDPAVALRND
jgi:putative ABC transport system permease protein